jgi:hypothetical protein
MDFALEARPVMMAILIAVTGVLLIARSSPDSNATVVL